MATSSKEAADAAASAKQRVSDAAHKTADRMSEAATRTADAARARVREGAQKLAGTSRTAADSLRRAAGDVEGENAWLGMALHKSADGVERLTQTLENADMRRLAADVQAFAQRQPALFLGLTAAAGFALARIGKTALQRADDEADWTQQTPASGGYAAQTSAASTTTPAPTLDTVTIPPSGQASTAGDI